MSRYIDVEALGIGKANPDVFEDAEYARGWNAAIEIIESASAADVAEVRHGEWINTGAYVCGEYEFECTECGYTNWHTSEANEKYCPGCGARMDRTGTAPDRWFKRIKQGDSRIVEMGMPRHFQIIETKVLGSLAGTLGWRFMWGEEKYGEFIEVEAEHIPTKKEIDYLFTKAFDTLKILMIWEIEGEENGNV